MRRSFSSLSSLVREELKQDPLSGHYFFFMNKSKNYVKLLYWDGTGYVLSAKKLPQGVFSKPNSKELLLQELLSILESPQNLAIVSKKKQKRYRFVPE
jgi:transposase